MTAVCEKQRIDQWLFFARVVKSRSLAAKLATGGRARVNDNKINQASYGIKPGDVLTITLPGNNLERRNLVYKVLLLGERRGPASEAQGLYEDISPPPPPKDDVRIAGLPQRDAGSGRPTKRDRRAIDRLRCD